MVKHLFASFFLLLSLFPTTLIAQWGYPYSNSWIDFSKPYVKIGITTSGLQKISFSSLPYDFPVNQPEKIQLFHLGKEVSILSTDNNEILFYAVPNDGATDSLLYRPMSSRLNPYSSIYSNRTAYFLTIGNLAGKRAVRVLTDKNSNLEPTKVHIQKYLQSNTQEYSHSTAIYIKPEFINSFFEHGASRTGVRLLGNKIIPFTIKLDSLQKNQTTQPSIKLLLHGRSNNSRAIEVYVGKDSLNLRKAGSVNIVDFIAQIFEFKIESTDIGANGALTFALKSTSTLPEERFSVGFYLVTYPQALILNSLESKIFNLPPINGSSSRIQISDYQNTYKSYDITDANNPTILDGSLSDFTMPRQTGKQTIIFSSKKINIVESSQILKTTFYKINPADFNYVIITNETLKDAANRYADYRSSAEGGSYSPIVIKIKDIYDQFNYGEVSPVAIRRFIDYTMSDSNKDKYLLLFGKSITFVERMLPELSEDVPSVGYPGSDLLLVDGLAGFPVNVPAMPVGRISAVTEVQADNYLEKVKEYEGNVSGSFEWKKRVLHLNGGKTVDEINTFKNSLSTLSPLITKGTVGGTVKAFVKQSLIEVESVNIAPEVNEGVGMISYIGHGAQTLTDFDFGYVSAVNRGYENPSKYPLMYFNGCGVGNIFNARLNSNINASDKMPLSLDWMLSKQKGAIAVIANSFDSYLAPTVHYLDELYSVLFADSTAEKLPIGKIQQRIAKNILMGNNNSYDIANVHQSLLQGDPALHLIRVPYPDYSLDPDQSISLYSESANTSIGNSKTLKIAIKISNWGRYIKQQEIPVEIKYYYKNGTSQVVNELVNAIAYEDTIFVKYDGIGQNLQRINVKIDPDAKLTELNTNNNVSELIIDWDIASAEIIYPAQNVKDIVPPLLNVMFNGRFIANEEIIFPNPIITFTLQDDRLIQLDTSLISIYIKPCGDESCDYKRLILNNNDLIKIRAISDHSIEVVYHPEDIQGGIYEMLVSTHDMSGNSESNSYSIRFIVANDVVNKAVQVVCSPNPSSDYVKFEIKDVELSSFTSVQWAIYDPNGLLLENRSIEPSQLFGRTWYWIPQVKSGVYIYKIHLNDKSNKLYEVTGKVIVVN